MLKRSLFTSKKRQPLLLTLGGGIFILGVLLLWIFSERLGLELSDLLLMTGLALILFSLSVSSKRTEKKIRQQEEDLRKIREQCGKGDYNNDIFYD